ncbi:MAG: DNA repair protein RecN, partial [Bowdeniella nasicola]|nr:DNA repair protein RecN [Bowdeniella nasicola]
QRCHVGQMLEEAVASELAALAMPKARLIISITPTEFAPHGGDDITFKLQAHPGAPALPLGQGASGGELSRIMLALELCVATGAKRAGHTFVFDEIDAGIGGTTARHVGERLARLATHHQVIVVTHIAQVAAFARHHAVVVKTDQSEQATTEVRNVDGKTRELEIARMLGGTDTKTALRHAAELINAANVAR